MMLDTVCWILYLDLIHEVMMLVKDITEALLLLTVLVLVLLVLDLLVLDLLVLVLLVLVLLMILLALLSLPESVHRVAHQLDH